MKIKLIVAALFALMFASYGFAGENEGTKSMPTPPAASAELEHMKSLAGHWEGITKHSNGTEEPVAVDYKVTSGGSAVVETLSPGTSHEMVSIYHDANEKLEMTHYCMLGNHPTLTLESSNDKQFNFDASAQTKSELAGKMYMNSLVLDRPSEKELVQTWTALNPDGSPSDSTVFSLKHA